MSQADQDAPTVLIVDDSFIMRRKIKACVLKERNYTILEAGDGQEGLEIFRKEHPDFIFMDLNMPVMDGIECIKGIFNDTPEALIIVCTADIQKETTRLVLELGALTSLRKPPTKEDVLLALEKAEEKLRER